MLRLRNEATFALGELCNVRSGRLRIGANESISLHFLPRLAEAFLKQYPSVSIEVKCERSASLLANLKDRNLEVALLSFRPKDKDLDAKIVAQDELVLITHPSHPSVGKRNVRIRDLSVEPLLGMDVSEPSPWHQKVADALVPFNTPLNLRIENAPIETIKKMVALGLGIAFVPLMSVGEERERGELAVIDVEDFHQERSVWLVRRRAVQSHAAKAFVEVAVRFGASAIPVRGLPQQETPDTKAARKVLMVRRG
jgi:DNA-binding transcriptional LysR family regulator